jgi:hypothetical protein
MSILFNNPLLGASGQGPSADLGDTINQSIRLRLNNSVLSSTLAATPSSSTITVSFWFKSIGTRDTNIFRYFYGCGNHAILNQGYLLTVYNTTGAASSIRGSRDAFTDPSAWYHFVGQYSSGSYKLWVNGVQWSTTTIGFSPSTAFRIGGWNLSGGDNDGNRGLYLADFHFLDGTAKDETDFGKYNDDGVWVPIAPSFTAAEYGAGGFHLTFDSSQSNATEGIGEDSAPIGASGHTARNDFTSTSINSTAISSSNRLSDVDYTDTPTSNYATFNPLWPQTRPSLKDGNMVLNTAQAITGQATFRFPVGTTGKYWVEAGTANLGATENAPALCLTSELDAAGLSNTAWSTTANYSSIGGYQQAFSNFTSTSATSYTTVGGQVGMAIDFDAQEVKMYNNSSLINTDTTVDFTKELAIVVMQPTTSYDTYEPYLNAGQQDFIQTVPTGFKELQTNNLPEPTIKNGKEHFGVLTYTGGTSFPITIDGSGGNNGDGELDFDGQPDFVWIKMRNGDQNHILFDTVRGVTKSLRSDGTNAESTRSNFAFATNGFTFSAADAESYQQNDSYVAWCWKAGGTAVSNSDGTITSSVSANTDAGFSIVSYTGNATNGATVGHGLTTTPEFIILKDRDTAVNWIVYNEGIDTNPEQFFLHLNTDVAKQDLGDVFNDVAPGSSVFTLGNSTQSNGSTKKYIAYCWHSVEGYSKFGSYDGNDNADGVFVYLGFRPAMIILKAVGQGWDWFIWDTTRDTSNPSDTVLKPNLTQNESTAGSPVQEIDILSNGFKIRGANQVNQLTDHIYAAWAESPFGGENAPPATAR